MQQGRVGAVRAVALVQQVGALGDGPLQRAADHCAFGIKHTFCDDGGIAGAFVQGAGGNDQQLTGACVVLHAVLGARLQLTVDGGGLNPLRVGVGGRGHPEHANCIACLQAGRIHITGKGDAPGSDGGEAIQLVQSLNQCGRGGFRVCYRRVDGAVLRSGSVGLEQQVGGKWQNLICWIKGDVHYGKRAPILTFGAVAGACGIVRGGFTSCAQAPGQHDGNGTCQYSFYRSNRQTT